MTLIISNSIKSKEIKAGDYNEGIVIDGFFGGIGVIIKGSALPKGTRLWKVYETTTCGARRLVYLVDATTGDGFFLFYRDKNDRLGKNISIKNKYFETKLHEYLDLLSHDLDNDHYSMFEKG